MKQRPSQVVQVVEDSIDSTTEQNQGEENEEKDS